ncbi:MAG: DUF3102 domain-containing protein [Planctomycetaceae bacterium]|nr:DUF3102 domain-containing protein [Planctomycetaceae bacterium]
MQTTIMVDKRVAECSLSNLANAANEAHRLAKEHANTTVEYARRAGEILKQAKEQVNHGLWLPWLDQNCPEISARTAQRYMQLHRELPAPNTSRVSHSETDDPQSIRQAIELVKETKPTPTPKPQKLCDTPFRTWPDEERRRWIWDTPWGFDQLWEQSILLDAMDWPIERIAETLFVEPIQVELALSPRPPERFDTDANGRSLKLLPKVNDLARAYQERIEAKYLTLQFRVVSNLNGRREQEQIDDGVMTDLDGLSRRAVRRWKQIEQTDPLRKLDRVDRTAIELMAIGDHRAGLWIEAVSYPRRLTEWFGVARAEVAELPEGGAA